MEELKSTLEQIAAMTKHIWYSPEENLLMINTIGPLPCFEDKKGEYVHWRFSYQTVSPQYWYYIGEI